MAGETPAVLHGFGDEHEGAAKIFDILPDDPFGEGEGEENFGQEEDEGTPPTGSDESEDEEPLEADEADEEDEDEDEEGSEDGEDDDEDESDEEYGPQTFTVKVDGEEVEVTEQDLLDGYSRTADYTRKTQKLAEERKSFQQTAEQVQQERVQLAQKLIDVEEFLVGNMPSEPTSDDPKEWVRYQREMQRLNVVQQERQALEQRMAAERDNAEREFVAEQNAKLQEIVDEWKEPEAFQSGLKSLSKYAVGTLGFTDEELGAVKDHRVILMLKKAYEYDQLEDAKKTVKSKAKTAKTLRPGAPKKRSSQKTKAKKEARAARERLRKSGRVQDAAAIIFDNLDYE